VVSDKGDEFLQHDRTMGNVGRSKAEGDDGWGVGAHQRGQSAVASLLAASVCLWRPAVDRRQGGRSGAHAVLAEEEEGGRKGRATLMAPF
jgi:hypothetical protein